MTVLRKGAAKVLVPYLNFLIICLTTVCASNQQIPGTLIRERAICKEDSQCRHHCATPNVNECKVAYGPEVLCKPQCLFEGGNSANRTGVCACVPDSLRINILRDHSNSLPQLPGQGSNVFNKAFDGYMNHCTKDVECTTFCEFMQPRLCGDGKCIPLCFNSDILLKLYRDSNVKKVCTCVSDGSNVCESGELATHEVDCYTGGGSGSVALAPTRHAPLPDRIVEEDEDQPEQPARPSAVGDHATASMSENSVLPLLHPEVKDVGLTCAPVGFLYKWRIDLSQTERYWSGWFKGLSAQFLAVKAPKLLLLASIDGLDKELMVGQMQGKFQLQVLTRCGHAVHEDTPGHVAQAISAFALRYRLTEPTENGDMAATGSCASAANVQPE